MAANRNSGRKAAGQGILLAAGLVLTAAVTAPVWPTLARRAVTVSVAAAFPEGSISALRQKFSPPDDGPVENPPAAALQDLVLLPPAEEERASAAEEAPIPTEFRGTLVRECFGWQEGRNWLPLGKGWLNNHTGLSHEEITEALNSTPRPVIPKAKTPKVLLVHTHATESYETHRGACYDIRADWRSRKETENVCAVGEAMARELEQAGITVLHDTTQHDYPSYNGSYDRSRETVQNILKEHPDVDVILDIHRDAILREENTLVAPVTSIGGRDCAQVMIAAGCDDGTMDYPGWRRNLRFGAELCARMEEAYPTLTRPVFFCHRRYNQNLHPNMLLLEVGAAGNTLEEAVYAGQLTGQVLAQYILSLKGENS